MKTDQQPKTPEEAFAARAPFRNSWGLLGEWWCVPDDMSAEEQKAFVDKVHEGFMGNGIGRDLIEDRLFGCYPCSEKGRCHVYFSSGSYTFLRPEANSPMEANDRARVWEQLVKEGENGEPNPKIKMFNDYQKS